jgi:hypothetical protein
MSPPDFIELNLESPAAVSECIVEMQDILGAKMAAHWGKESQEHRVTNIVTVMFLVLVGTMISLLFAMIGGLICAGKLWL